MVLPAFRPMTIAAAATLVAGSAFTSYTTVYADEYNRYKDDEYQGRRHYNNDDDIYDREEGQTSRRPSSENYSQRNHQRFNDQPTRLSKQPSLVSQEEELMPGLLFVALAGLTGTLVARQRNILIRMFSPLAFGAAGGAYFLPNTTHSIIESIGGPAPSAQAHHSSGQYKLSHAPSSSLYSTEGDSMSGTHRGELASHARDAWRNVESNAEDVGDSVRRGARRAQGAMSDARDEASGEAQRMNRNASSWIRSKADDMEDQYENRSRDARGWLDDKSSDAEDAMYEMEGKARRARRDAKGWMDSKRSEAEDMVDEFGDRTNEFKDRARGTASNAKYWLDDKSSEVEERASQLNDKAKSKAQETKHWWSRKSSDAEEKAKELGDRAEDATKQAKHWFSITKDDVEHKAKEFEDKTEGKAKELGNKADEAARQAKGWLSRTSSDAEEKAKELGEKAQELSEKASEKTTEVKHWWSRRSSEADQTYQEIKEKSQQAANKLGELKDKSVDMSEKAATRLGELKDKSVDVSQQASVKLGELKDRSVEVSHQAGEKLGDLKDKSKEVASWVGDKAHDASKVAEDVSAKAVGAANATKDWVDGATAAIDKKLEASVKEADEWWETQAAAEEKRKMELMTENKQRNAKAWLKHHADKIASAEKTGASDAHANANAYTSSDSFMDGVLDKKDMVDHDEMARTIDRDPAKKAWIKRHAERIAAAERTGASDAHANANAYTSSDSFMDGVLDKIDIVDHDEMARVIDQDPAKKAWIKRHAERIAAAERTGASDAHANASAYTSSDSFMDGVLDKIDIVDHDEMARVINQDPAKKAWIKRHAERIAAAERTGASDAHANANAYTSSDSFMDGVLDKRDIVDHGEIARVIDQDPAKKAWIKHQAEKIAAAEATGASDAHANANAYTSSDSFMDGVLDKRDIVDHGEKTGFTDQESALNPRHAKSWTERELYMLTRPKQSEYWSNGEEIGSASVRDANYYNYIGSFAGSSLGRSSWWSRRAAENDKVMSSLKDKAETLVWEAKKASEKAHYDFAKHLADEQASLEKAAENARRRAEDAALQAKAQSEILIRERKAALERAAKDMEKRFEEEQLATERAAADVKAKAEAWEKEQRILAEKTAKAANDRLVMENLAADQTAATLKARAEAWATEQKEKAEKAAKEARDVVFRETSTAEKNVQEAKAMLEAKVKAGKLDVERATQELEDKIKLAKANEEKIQAQKLKEEKTTALEAKKRAETLLHESKRSAEETKPTGTGWVWPWFSSTTKSTTSEPQAWWSSGSSTSSTGSEKSDDVGINTSPEKYSDVGINVEAAAAKAERDVKARAPQVSKDVHETAKKAYKNVLDAATTVEGQASNAEVEATKATEEGKKWWDFKTKPAEKKLDRFEGELEAGLNKAGEKIREMDREAAESNADFWQKQQRQQQERRGGRAM